MEGGISERLKSYMCLFYEKGEKKLWMEIMMNEWAHISNTDKLFQTSRKHVYV